MEQKMADLPKERIVPDLPPLTSVEVDDFGPLEIKRGRVACITSAFKERSEQLEVEWSFNPPAGSHHGGVWERVIRIVKKVLNSVLHQQTLDDDGLHTVMCEVEAILNDRPI